MPAESALPPVTFGVKVTRDDGPGGHVHFDLFAGRTAHARGRSGSLVLRHDEFEEFLARLKPETIATAELLHARDGIYWNRNRCGTLGGLATNDDEATCGLCREVIDGRAARRKARE